MMEVRTDANGRKYVYYEESAKNQNELASLRAEVASIKERRDAERKDLIGMLERSQNKLGKADMKIDDLKQGRARGRT